MNFHGRPHWSNTEYCHNNWPPQWVLNSNKHIYKTQTSFMCIGICWFIADSQSKSCVDLPLCPDLGYQAQRNLFMSAQLLINHTDESKMQIRIKINSDWSDYRNPKKKCWTTERANKSRLWPIRSNQVGHLGFNIAIPKSMIRRECDWSYDQDSCLFQIYIRVGTSCQ